MATDAPVATSLEVGKKGSAGGLTWRSLFRWYWPTSAENSAESETNLLERWGGIPTRSDPDHVRLGPVFLAEGGPAAGDRSAPPNSVRFINTAVIDQRDLSASAAERVNVVVCHGFGAGLGFFYCNLWSLSRSIDNSRIFAIDWLGMGRSGRPAFPKFQTSAAQDSTSAVDFFLDSFEEWRSAQPGLDRFVLIGHSMGGYLSALYALRHPHRVQKLILASPGKHAHTPLTATVGLPEQPADSIAVTGHKLPAWFSRLWNSNYTPQGILRALGPMGPRFAMGYVDKRFAYLADKERTDLGRYFYHISADVGSGEYALAALLAPGAWAREPLFRRLPSIAMPTTFLYGEHDWMDRNHAESAASEMQVPVRIISVPDAGHHLNLDNPEEFNRIVTEEVLKID